MIYLCRLSPTVIVNVLPVQEDFNNFAPHEEREGDSVLCLRLVSIHSPVLEVYFRL